MLPLGGVNGQYTGKSLVPNIHLQARQIHQMLIAIKNYKIQHWLIIDYSEVCRSVSTMYVYNNIPGIIFVNVTIIWKQYNLLINTQVQVIHWNWSWLSDQVMKHQSFKGSYG